MGLRVDTVVRRVPRGRTPTGRAREWTLLVVLLALGLLLAACAAAPVPTATPAPKAPAAAPTLAPTTAAAAPTQAPAAATATSAPAAAATKPATPAKMVDLVYGVIGTVGRIPYDAGVKLGYWEKEGLKVEIIEHRGGAEVAQALAGGGVHMVTMDFTHIMRLNEGGLQYKALAPGFGKYSYKLLGPPGAPVGVQALKGKKIGISSPGSSTDNVMRYLLKTNNIDPDKDVELVAIGSGAPMLAALQNKQVSYGMTTEPVTAQLLQQNYVIAYDFIKELGPFYNSVHAAKATWLQTNGDAARAFMRGFYNVLKAIDSNAATLKEASKISMPTVADEKIRDEAFKNVLDSYPRDPKILKEGVETPHKVDQVARNHNNPLPDWQKMVDSSFNP